MHIKNLEITNFRAIKHITVDFDKRVNVIVGPNAIGKTTILEAIRLTKAMLSPRTQNESMQALFALGGSSPHLPQTLNFEALARDKNSPIFIRLTYQLDTEEIQWLEEAAAQIARSIVQGRMGQGFSNPAAMISFLSTSQGIAALAQANMEIQEGIAGIKNLQSSCVVKLKIDPQTGPAAMEGGLHAGLIAALDSRNPPGQTNFSYFPADRALPQGEQGVQLGGPDAQAQMESHNSQPQQKYARLKNTIFNSILTQDGKSNIQEDFARIFEGILKGRRIKGFGINHAGLLSLKVEDTESGSEFDIDAMSSGEKGLILTFLLIERSVTQNGVILLDEPELHLNPAVCKDLLSFLVDQYAIRKNLQIFVCSHSPEILAGAFERDQCSLYHLESEELLTKVRIQDQGVIAEALRRLGTSESEGMLYKGTLFVEGPDDITLLDAGFGELLRRYKLKDLGGRSEIEKQIVLLQNAEKKGEKLTPRLFIFDRDEAPSNLVNSTNVRILQWERRCFENYLLDFDIIADLVMDDSVVKNKLSSLGETQNLLKKLAADQLEGIAIKETYKQRGYESPGIRQEDLKAGTLEAVADGLHARLVKIQGQLSDINNGNWQSKFVSDCSVHTAALRETWETKWITACDGKRLFSDLCSKVQPNISPRKFKVRVMQEMRLKSTENWRAMKSLLVDLLNPTV